ncbi:MAG: transcription-repair coupling factor [Oscillospiraceae bacterium]|nr:transcription-repair coupling factor [Oscillospiraceae bacterium]
MILTEIKRTAEFIRLAESVENSKKPIALFGLSGTARAAYIAALSRESGKTVLVLTKDERSANRLLDDIGFFESDAQIFSPRDLMLRSVEGFSREYEYRRIRTLGNLVGKNTKIVIAPIEAAMMYTMPREKFLQNTLTVKDTDSLDRDRFIQKLVNAGYTRRDTVEGAGQFAVRGDIIDLYTPDMPLPVRIELWGDEIDRINTFELDTQRRIDKINKVHISPVKEVLFTSCDEALSAIHDFRQTLAPRARTAFDNATEKEIMTLESGVMPQSMDKYISMCYKEKATVFDYLDDALIFVDELSAVRERADDFHARHLREVQNLFEEGVLSKGMEEFYAPASYIMKKFLRMPTVVSEDFMRSFDGLPLSDMVSVVCNSSSAWNGEYKVLEEDLNEMTALGYRICILAGTEKAAQTLANDLSDMNFKASFVKKDGAVGTGSIVVRAGRTHGGFVLPQSKIALITGQKQNVGAVKKPRKRSRDAITSIEQLSKGDYVVHQNYGIGIYMGIESVTMSGVTKDYLYIKYDGTDSIYVPVTQLDLISGYSYSGDTEKVSLSKLGTETWKKQKARAKKATEEMAKELIELYAKREKAKGFAFEPDTEWQRDFEARFMYEETEDQLRAINEIKRDMESPHPMERLLCGDVGVGKTEVALRAAFKAVMSGKQVAILVPTTVLAWQHYETLLQRMSNFPVNIQMLSRFRSAKQRRATVRDINDGVADIVVGTHSLIQKNVKFKNLGLLIIDEEQRFGVAHKEKLVESFNGIDVLTLSATPIPRTLSMALNGIRDMSSMEQPPVDRIPIETYVSEFNTGIIASALNKELNRGGQCYYLHNRVETIDLCARKVQKMCPDARIGVAHGQMSEEALSSVWRALKNGDIDILVCTTIIETGVDVPNCNTLVIEDADRMGLAQLYQIRGRVGRSTRKAYAYFTFRKDKVLNEVAIKRLNAIKEFTSFGSGYRIAMRDLQIRGAGSVLGKTQSGFMTSIGYELYIKLLNQAIAVMKGEPLKREKSDCVIDVTVDAFIPESYISSTENRIEAYKRIAALETDDDISDILDELQDRYGDVPQSVLGLIDISVLRVAAAAIGVTEISQRKNLMMFYSDNYTRVNMAGFLKSAAAAKYKIGAVNSPRAYISVQVADGSKPIDIMKTTLKMLKDNLKEQPQTAKDGGKTDN